MAECVVLACSSFYVPRLAMIRLFGSLRKERGKRKEKSRDLASEMRDQQTSESGGRRFLLFSFFLLPSSSSVGLVKKNPPSPPRANTTDPPNLQNNREPPPPSPAPRSAEEARSLTPRRGRGTPASGPGARPSSRGAACPLGPNPRTGGSR